MEQSTLTQIGLPIALFVIMTGIGLSLSIRDFTEQFRAPRATFLGLIGQFLVIPLFTLAIAALFQLSPLLAIGLVLVGATPGGATSNLVAYLARGNVALSIILTAAASLAVILTLPAWMELAVLIIPGVEVFNIHVPILSTFGLLLFSVVLPVCLGMILQSSTPNLAGQLEKYVGVVGIIVLVALILGIIIQTREQAMQLLLEVGPAVLLFNIVAILLGGFTGWIGRLGKREQLTIAVEYSLRNTTLGMLIAFTIIQIPETAFASAVYSLVMYATAPIIIAVGRRMTKDIDRRIVVQRENLKAGV